jgi:2-dehydro-3-deoxy-L-rhamnonate dehydrogenase (NAD+)
METITFDPPSGAPSPSDDLAELRFDGKVALITGAARGIGRAIAELLGSRGARVGLFDRDTDALRTTGKELSANGIGCLALAGDVTASTDADAAVAECVEHWGSLDVMVNNAGIGGRSAPVWELADDEWRDVIEINLIGVFFFCRAAARRMRAQGSGRIVNIASIAGKEGNPNASHYSASKAGVIGLTKSLGKELATENVYVNAIAPAVIETEILQQVGQDHIDYMRSKIPMDRFGQPVEVARLVAFLASDHLTFSTGAVYDISGGRATY